jgi:predicted metal-dependent peptidase
VPSAQSLQVLKKGMGINMNIQDIVTKLLIEQPLFGYVASSVSLVEADNVTTIKMASVPELIIYYNPNWFESLSNQYKLGIVLHELLHVILLHQYRRGNRQILLWSIACDMAVNEMIPDKNIGADAVTVDKIARKIKRKIEQGKNAEYYYEIITDVNEIISLASREGDTILIFEGDNSIKAQKISEETATDMEVNALKSNLMQIISEARSVGEFPEGLGDRIDDVYKELQIDWRVILKRFLSGRGKMIIRKSYKRQSRRYEDLPGTKRSIGVSALIAIDESGSISDSLVKAFYQELQEINKITGTSMMVTRFDTECSKPVPLGTFVTDKKRIKRGGTDFRPIFELADQQKIPLVIIFTDGDGQAPVSANQNTLWVLTKNAKKPATFGYCLNFEG